MAHKTILAGAVAVLVAAAGAALAATVAFEQVDRDGVGFVTYAQVAAVLPEVTREAFDAADANGDGVLDRAEFAALAEG